MSRRALALVFVIALAVPCFGGNDAEFHAVVKTIETQYGVHHMRIPLLGFATFCLKIAGTPGTSGLKLAVFDHLPQPTGASFEAFEQSLEAAIGETWRPLVRVKSKDGSELTMVYTNPSDKELKVLIVCLEPNDATVVQAKVTAAQIRKWIQHPEDAADRDVD